MTVTGSVEHNVEQHRTSAHKATSARIANSLPRSHSTLKLNTEEGRKALVWLKQGKVEPVVKLVGEVTARGDETHLLMEILQAIYGTRDNQGALLDHFFVVLDALPNAHTATSAPFRGLLDVVRTRDTDDDRGTLRRLGVLCASKGYGDFVDSEIAPLVSEGSSHLEYAQWQRTVTLALAKFKGLVIDIDEVFEDVEGDYQSIPVAPLTSIMQSIEETLPECLPDPTPNALVFEDHGDDYTVLRSHTTHAKDHSSSDALQRVVRNGEFDKAYHLLEELGDIGHVEPSLVYLEAAIASTSLTESSTSDFLPMEKRLFAWLNLLPTHNDDLTYYVPSMMKLLRNLETLPNPDLPLLYKVSILLARKGYTRYLTKSFARGIFVYGSPQVICSFVAELEAAHRQYYSADYQGTNHTREHNIKAFIRGNAIRELARRREFTAALSLLPDPYGDCWNLTPTTYTYLLDSLESEGHEAIKTSRKIRDHLLGFASDHPLILELRAVLPTSFWERGHGTRRLAVQQPETVPSRLLNALAHFKRQAHSPRTPPPPPTTLTKIIPRCLSQERVDDLTVILNRALAHHFSFAASLLSAEMLYYQQTASPIKIIKTFVDHFHLVGVPTLRVLELSKEEYEIDTISPRNPGALGPRVPAVRIHDPSALHIHQKMWPSQDHVGLVWHALAALPQSNEAYGQLYWRLRDFVKHKGQDIDPELPARGIQPLVPPVNPMSSMAFTPFIRGLGLRISIRRGRGVFNDMALEGIQPTLVHFTQLANLYARQGFVAPALRILRSIEKMSDAKVAKRQGFRRNTRVTARVLKDVEPESEMLDVILYKSIFCGFVRSRRWLQAWKVDKEMKRRFGSEKVMDDEAYRKMYGIAYYKAWTLFKKHGYPTIAAHIQEKEDLEDGKDPRGLREKPLIPSCPPWLEPKTMGTSPLVFFRPPPTETIIKRASLPTPPPSRKNNILNWEIRMPNK